MAKPIVDIETRFWSKVDKSGGPDACWLWTGKKNNHGYGRHGKTSTAHRLAWELSFGDIPDGLCVCHKCDTRDCVNPSHLWLGTNADNVADKMNKGRHVSATGLRNGSYTRPDRRVRCIGEKNHFSKLTWPDVKRIRTMRASGALQKDIARAFRTTQSNISEILSHKTWTTNEIRSNP